MDPVANFESQLQALHALKPPGVTKTKITAISKLCCDSIQVELPLVQRLYTHFKKTPATHKLGVIYVVDAVTRAWVDLAVNNGEDPYDSSAATGSYARGVQRMTEFLPPLMVDLISTAPDDQKSIGNQRANKCTKEKILKLIGIWEQGNIFPIHMLSTFKSALAPTVAMLEATKESEKSSASTKAVAVAAAPHQTSKISRTDKKPTNSAEQAMKHAGIDALSTILPAHAMKDKQTFDHYLSILQELVDRGVPSDMWKEVIDKYDGRAPNANRSESKQQEKAVSKVLKPAPKQTKPEPSRNRSRSPARKRSSPANLSPSSVSKRQRVPNPKDPSIIQLPPEPYGDRFLHFDVTVPEGCIKVLSRTLYVIGTNSNANDLKTMFSQFGEVQSFIPEPKRKTAFVKMYSREAADAARTGANERSHIGNAVHARETRWGAGFGNRDHFDYDTGLSILPIEGLTEDERRCAMQAENGGTGGRPLQSGMVMEEPDIDFKPIPRAKRQVAPQQSAPLPASYANSKPSQGNFQPYYQPPYVQHNRPAPVERMQPIPYQRPAANAPSEYDQGTAVAVPSFGIQLPTMTNRSLTGTNGRT